MKSTDMHSIEQIVFAVLLLGCKDSSPSAVPHYLPVPFLANGQVSSWGYHTQVPLYHRPVVLQQPQVPLVVVQSPPVVHWKPLLHPQPVVPVHWKPIVHPPVIVQWQTVHQERKKAQDEGTQGVEEGQENETKEEEDGQEVVPPQVPEQPSWPTKGTKTHQEKDDNGQVTLPPQVPEEPKWPPLGTKHHKVNEASSNWGDGSYRYSFRTKGFNKAESADKAGNVEGYYVYTDGEGKVRKTAYTSRVGEGFKVVQDGDGPEIKGNNEMDVEDTQQEMDVRQEVGEMTPEELGDDNRSHGRNTGLPW